MNKQNELSTLTEKKKEQSALNDTTTKLGTPRDPNATQQKPTL